MEDRLSRKSLFRGIIQLLSMRSTCGRACVGSILVKDNRIISTGYNGAPKGMPHCDDEGVGCHLNEEGACDRTVHAEANVVAFAARNGIATEGSTLYTTMAPCYTCSKLLINAGIKKVYYIFDYRKTDGVDLLRSLGVECEYLSEVQSS